MKGKLKAVGLNELLDFRLTIQDTVDELVQPHANQYNAPETNSHGGDTGSIPIRDAIKN
jgi:hypothetical protein